MAVFYLLTRSARPSETPVHYHDPDLDIICTHRMSCCFKVYVDVAKSLTFTDFQRVLEMPGKKTRRKFFKYMTTRPDWPRFTTALVKALIHTDDVKLLDMARKQDALWTDGSESGALHPKIIKYIRKHGSKKMIKFVA